MTSGCPSDEAGRDVAQTVFSPSAPTSSPDELPHLREAAQLSMPLLTLALLASLMGSQFGVMVGVSWHSCQILVLLLLPKGLDFLDPQGPLFTRTS